MKKMNYFLFATLFIASATLTSCSKDDHDDDGCQECHIALDNGDNTETMWEITNAIGGEDFCGPELEATEDATYLHTVTDTLYSASGDTLLPGPYGESNGYEIHCEEHDHLQPGS